MAKSIFSPSLAIYSWATAGDRRTVSLVSNLPCPQHSPYFSIGLEVMENSKRFPEKVLIGSASSFQRLHHQEGISRDAPTASRNRTNSVRPLGPSSLTACRQLPCHQRRRIDNDDLLASIDRHGQSLIECLSLAESALAMVRCRSPPAVDSMEDRLAKAEAKIAGEIPVVTSASFQFCLQDSDHPL